MTPTHEELLAAYDKAQEEYDQSAKVNDDLGVLWNETRVVLSHVQTMHNASREARNRAWGVLQAAKRELHREPT